MCIRPLKLPSRQALWPKNARHLLAISILPFLLLVSALAWYPLQTAAAKGLFGPMPMTESGVAPPASVQEPTPLTSRARGPAPDSTDASAGKTAEQWMLDGEKAQKSDSQMEAVNDFLNAQRLAPTSPKPLYALGMSFFFIGSDENDTSYYDRAARHFRAALELDPQYDRAAFMMGMMEVLHNRPKEADAYFQRAIALSPQNYYYHLYYGMWFERMDNSDGAAEQMLLAEKLGPSYPQSYLALGQLYARLRKYQEARGQLERAVRLNPNLTAAYYTMGSVYHHLGMNSESQSAYETFRRQSSAQPKPDPMEKAMQSGTSTGPK